MFRSVLSHYYSPYCSLLAAAARAAAARPTTPVSSSGNTAPGVVASFTLQDVEATPYAVWADELSKRTITVKARSTTTGNVALQLSYFDGLVGGSGAQIVKAMYDDGTNGDQIARDGVWTLTFSLGLAEPDHLRLYDGQVDAVSISIAATDGTKPLSPSNSIDARVDVAVLSRATDSEFPVHAIDAATQATDTMLNIVDPHSAKPTSKARCSAFTRQSAQTRSISRCCFTRAPPATACRVRSA